MSAVFNVENKDGIQVITHEGVPVSQDKVVGLLNASNDALKECKETFDWARNLRGGWGFLSKSAVAVNGALTKFQLLKR